MMKTILTILYCLISLQTISASEHLKTLIFEPVQINGTKQFLLIRANNNSKPVLLYLHGGPGQSLIPFAYKATDKLINNFIVVYWDQRGTGLSYNENIPRNTMTMEQMIKDTQTVTEYLKKKFNKKKIYLLGHSWGSNLGLQVIYRHPENYFAFIGVGQVVCPAEQERLGIIWLKERLLLMGSPKEKALIKPMEERNFTDRALLKKYGGVLHNITSEQVSEIMRNSPYKSSTYTSSLYLKGLQFAAPLHEQVKSINFFKQIPEIKIPVYFFLGKYDHITPTKPVVKYYQSLKAPYKKIIWFNKSGHRIDIEESEKFQKEIMKIARPRE